jgi:hypothetical protein
MRCNWPEPSRRRHRSSQTKEFVSLEGSHLDKQRPLETRDDETRTPSLTQLLEGVTTNLSKQAIESKEDTHSLVRTPSLTQLLEIVTTTNQAIIESKEDTHVTARSLEDRADDVDTRYRKPPEDSSDQSSSSEMDDSFGEEEWNDVILKTNRARLRSRKMKGIKTLVRAQVASSGFALLAGHSLPRTRLHRWCSRHDYSCVAYRGSLAELWCWQCKKWRRPTNQQIDGTERACLSCRDLLWPDSARPYYVKTTKHQVCILVF